MISPWFTPQTAHWLSYLSLFALASVLAGPISRGRHRSAVTAVFAAGTAAGIGLLITGTVALSLGQPRHVILPFFIAGVCIGVGLGGVLASLPRLYARAELRRMEATNL